MMDQMICPTKLTYYSIFTALVTPTMVKGHLLNLSIICIIIGVGFVYVMSSSSAGLLVRPYIHPVMCRKLTAFYIVNFK